MLINFRQGIVVAPSNFLQPAGPASVNIVVGAAKVVAAIADGEANYLVQINTDQLNAYVGYGSTAYFWVELSKVNGQLSYGYTPFTVAESAESPTALGIGQMWYNTDLNKMYVWDGAKWNHVLRVMLGLKDDSGVHEYGDGTQVGVSGVSVSAGYVLTDALGNTFISSTGELLTSGSELLSLDSSSLVKLDNAQIVVLAGQPLAAFTCVYLANGKAVRATSSAINGANVTKAPIAMVTVSVAANEPVELYMAGRQVFNALWTFASDQIGKAAYCDVNGQVTTVKPTNEQYVKIGNIISANSIFLTFDTYNAPPNFGGVMALDSQLPMYVEGTASNPEIKIYRADESTDGYLASDDFNRIVTIEGEVLDLGSNKFGLDFPVPSFSYVVGLTTALDGKAPTVHNHDISDVSGLQDAVDDAVDVALQTAIIPGGSVMVPNPPGADITLVAKLSAIDGELDGKVDEVAGTLNNVVIFGAGSTIADGGASISSLIAKYGPTNQPGLGDVVGLNPALASKLNVAFSVGVDTPDIVIGRIVGLPGVVASVANKADKVSGAVAGHLASLDASGNLLDSGSSVSNFAIAGHNHPPTSIVGGTNGQVVMSNGTNGNWSTLTVAIENISGLQDILNTKLTSAGTVNTIPISQVINLSTQLAGKLGVSQTIPISQVINLQTALDGKAPTIHTHTISNVTGLQPALDGKLNLSGGTMTGGLVATTVTLGTVVLANDGTLSVGGNPGVSGQVLKSNGPGTPIQWAYSTGLPGGGAINQVLVKNSGADYDASWQNQSPFAAPAGQIVYGSGPSVAYSSDFTYTAPSSVPTITLGGATIYHTASGITVKGKNNAATGENVSITGGDSTSANGGAIFVTSGSTSATSTSSGAIFIKTADSGGTATYSGNVNIGTGIPTGLPAGSFTGSVILSTGGFDRLVITGYGAFSIGGGPGSAGQVLQSNGGGSTPTWVTLPSPGAGTVTSVNVAGGSTGLSFTGGPVTSSGTITASGTLLASSGGTGLASYAIGDLLYADSSSSLAALSAGANGYLLQSNGPSTAPSWLNPTTLPFVATVTSTSGLSFTGTSNLTMAGTLLASSGGTGLASYASGDLLYATGATTLAKLAIAPSGGYVLRTSIGLLPEWVDQTSLPFIATADGGTTGLTFTGSADVVLGGTLVAANGGTGQASYTSGDLLYATGATTLSKLGIGGANTVLASVGAVPTWVDISGLIPDTSDFLHVESNLYYETGSLFVETLSGVDNSTDSDLQVSITTPGTGYSDGAYPDEPLTGGSGSGATADIVVAGGAIITVNVTEGGTGYVVSDVLSAAIPGGAGFTVTVDSFTPEAEAFTTIVANVLDLDLTSSLQVNGSSGSSGQVLVSAGGGAPPSWQTIGGGSVTSVGTGTGLTGGPITTSGTISLSSGSIASLNLANTALQPAAIGVTVQGYSANLAAWSALATSAKQDALGFTPYNSTNPAGYTSNTGTVTSINVATSGVGISASGGPVTTTGTITITSNATSANTASTIVARDGSGNFTAGTISAALSGNATTATTASTANALATGNNYQINSLGVNTAASGTAGEIRATNEITAYYSDMRLKSVVSPITSALAKVNSLDGFMFRPNEIAIGLGYKDKVDIGLSAQQVEAVLPEVIREAPIDAQYKTLDYAKLVPLLVEAIKELTTEVNDLKSKLAAKG